MVQIPPCVSAVHNRDKLRGWKAERGSRREEIEEEVEGGKREMDSGRSLLCTQFPRGRDWPAAVSLRENKVSLRVLAHAYREMLPRTQEGGGGGSLVLINIFSGIHSEIKLTARICELFVTGYSRRPFPSRSFVAFETLSFLLSHHTDYESLQFFPGSLSQFSV